MSSASISLRIATLGPLGRSPYAPGTVASAFAGIPAAWLLGLAPIWGALSAILALTVVGCLVSSQAEKEMGRRDPGEVVIDELIGCIIAAVGLPTGFQSLFLAFLLFRLLDIWKPWPIGAAERAFRGGVGIVMDDVLAGFAANLIGRLILHLWP